MKLIVSRYHYTQREYLVHAVQPWYQDTNMTVTSIDPQGHAFRSLVCLRHFHSISFYHSPTGPNQARPPTRPSKAGLAAWLQQLFSNPFFDQAGIVRRSVWLKNFLQTGSRLRDPTKPPFRHASGFRQTPTADAVRRLVTAYQTRGRENSYRGPTTAK